MQKIYKKIIIISILTIAVLSNFYFISVGLASTNTEMQAQLNHAAAFPWGGNVPSSGPTSLSGIVATVVQVFLGLLGIIFLVLIIYAGYEWMTAQGDEEKVTKAKDTLTRAIIGLVIIIAAYSITYFVFSNLPGGEGVGGNGPLGGS